MSLTQSIPCEPSSLLIFCRFEGGSVLLQYLGQFEVGVINIGIKQCVDGRKAAIGEGPLVADSVEKVGFSA
jgi:hypothetical protein